MNVTAAEAGLILGLKPQTVQRKARCGVWAVKQRQPFLLLDADELVSWAAQRSPEAEARAVLGVVEVLRERYKLDEFDAEVRHFVTLARVSRGIADEDISDD